MDVFLMLVGPAPDVGREQEPRARCAPRRPHEARRRRRSSSSCRPSARATRATTRHRRRPALPCDDLVDLERAEPGRLARRRSTAAARRPRALPRPAVRGQRRPRARPARRRHAPATASCSRSRAATDRARPDAARSRSCASWRASTRATAPTRASAAKKRGCDDFRDAARHRRRLPPVHAARAARASSRAHKDDASIGELRRMTSTLDKITARRALRVVGQASRSGRPSSASRPTRPTRSQSPIKEVPRLHGRGRVARVQEPARRRLLAVPVRRRRDPRQRRGPLRRLPVRPQFENGRKKPGVYTRVPSSRSSCACCRRRSVEVFGGVRAAGAGARGHGRVARRPGEVQAGHGWRAHHRRPGLLPRAYCKVSGAEQARVPLPLTGDAKSRTSSRPSSRRTRSVRIRCDAMSTGSLRERLRAARVYLVLEGRAPRTSSSPRCAAASTSCSCATSTHPTTRSSRAGRELRALCRAARRAVPRERPARPRRRLSAPTACTSARTTCRSTRRARSSATNRIVGTSTHSPEQVDAGRGRRRRLLRRRPGVRDADQGGPPGVGWDLIALRGRARDQAVVRDRRHGRRERGASRPPRVPTRVVVVRAIRDADDPEAAARAMRAALGAEERVGAAQ